MHQPAHSPMLREYLSLIAARDGVLRALRTTWMSARCDSERRAAMSQINENLDERSRLMKLRDACAANNL